MAGDGAAEPASTAASAAAAAEPRQPDGQQQDEDKEECGWCKWMKAGGCKDEFEVWLKCVDGVRDAGRDDVETCASVMGPLWECMAKNADYYAPQVDALKEGRSGQEEGATATGEGGSSGVEAPAMGARGKDDPDDVTEQEIVEYLERLDKAEQEKP